MGHARDQPVEPALTIRADPPIQRVATHTHPAPSGSRCSRSANARTNRPRSRGESDTSVASPTIRQRNSPISCALCTQLPPGRVVDSNDRPGSRSLTHRPRRARFDLQQPAHGQRRCPRPWPPAPQPQRRHPRAHPDRLHRVSSQRPRPGERASSLATKCIRSPDAVQSLLTPPTNYR